MTESQSKNDDTQPAGAPGLSAPALAEFKLLVDQQRRLIDLLIKDQQVKTKTEAPAAPSPAPSAPCPAPAAVPPPSFAPAPYPPAFLAYPSPQVVQVAPPAAPAPARSGANAFQYALIMLLLTLCCLIGWGIYRGGPVMTMALRYWENRADPDRAQAQAAVVAPTPAPVAAAPAKPELKAEPEKPAPAETAVASVPSATRMRDAFSPAAKPGSETPVQEPVLPVAKPSHPAPVPTGEPSPLRVKAGSTSVVRAPFAADSAHVIYRWSTSAPVGQGGTFSSPTTGMPEVAWTAPALPGTLTVQVVACDAYGQETTVKLSATVDPFDPAQRRELKPWTRLGGDAEVAMQRLQRDETGVWWGLADDKLLCLGSGWNQQQALAFAEPPRRPTAFWATRDGVIVLDASSTSVRTFNREGKQVRAYSQLSRPTDLALAQDGMLAIADKGKGGVLTLGPDGKMVGQLGRIGEGDDAFRSLTRLALAIDGSLSCLDPEQRQVLRFDRLRRLGTLALPKDKASLPIDIAHASNGRDLLVLTKDGRVLSLDGQGGSTVVVKAPAESDLVAKPGDAIALAVDPAGDILITWDEGLVSRQRAGGAAAWRGARLRKGGPFATDGQGRIIRLDADARCLEIFDAEGWLTRRIPTGKAEDVRALAVVPDGSAVHLLDRKNRQILRFRLDDGHLSDPPAVFGQEGKNPGQFEAVTDLAVDAAGRSYVLDDELCRVSIFDSNGRFIASCGSKGKGPQELASPSLLTAMPDGSAVFVYDSKNNEMKKWACDTGTGTGKITYVGIGGGSGDGPAQFRAPFRLACDRLGLLYVLDSSRNDLQVLDFHGTNPVPVHARKAAEIGLDRISAGAVSPDGQVWLAHDGRMVGLSW